MKAECPKCGRVFFYPKKDRVNVILFGNWKNYHDCKLTDYMFKIKKLLIEKIDNPSSRKSDIDKAQQMREK